MKYELVKLRHLSGNKASIYAIWFEELNQTSFEILTNENKVVFKSEIKDITSRLITIGKIVGAREQYFKTGEGIPVTEYVHYTMHRVRNSGCIVSDMDHFF
jgi:hypothetical protein